MSVKQAQSALGQRLQKLWISVERVSADLSIKNIQLQMMSKKVKELQGQLDTSRVFARSLQLQNQHLQRKLDCCKQIGLLSQQFQFCKVRIKDLQRRSSILAEQGQLHQKINFLQQSFFERIIEQVHSGTLMAKVRQVQSIFLKLQQEIRLLSIPAILKQIPILQSQQLNQSQSQDKYSYPAQSQLIARPFSLQSFDDYFQELPNLQLLQNSVLDQKLQGMLRKLGGSGPVRLRSDREGYLQVNQYYLFDEQGHMFRRGEVNMDRLVQLGLAAI